MKIPIVERGNSRSLPPFGDETTKFHTMRMVLDRENSMIEYYVDDRRFAWLRYEGKMGPITNLRADLQTPHQDKAVDIRYDNLRVRVFGDAFDTQLSEVGKAEWKRQDPVAEHLIWFRDAKSFGLADSEARRITRFDTLLGIAEPKINAVIFGPQYVWVGTTKGLLAWDRKRGFWQRVAVGAKHLEADVRKLAFAGRSLRVVIRLKNGTSAAFDYLPGSKSWRDSTSR